jgi:redox-sensitive bicupin YhaK (pirin superfamily)
MCDRIRTSVSPLSTYLFEGEVFHRDSLGSALAIRPGEVNLMQAGRGIVHSERETSQANLVTGGHGLAQVEGAPPQTTTRRLFGIQAWRHYRKRMKRGRQSSPTTAPQSCRASAPKARTLRLVLGSAYGARSPVEFPHEALFCRSRAGAGCCTAAGS